MAQPHTAARDLATTSKDTARPRRPLAFPRLRRTPKSSNTGSSTCPARAAFLEERVLELILLRDGSRARRLMADAIAAGARPEDVATEVLRPAVRALTDLRQSGLITTDAHRDALVGLRELAADTAIGTTYDGCTPAVSASPFVRILSIDDVLVARPRGPALGERETTVVSREVVTAVESADAHMRRLVLDMGEIEMMSSVALGMCVELRRAARNAGMRPCMCAVSDRLRGLLRMMKVDRGWVIEKA